MTEQSYRKLVTHLDRLPAGFASGDTEAELRLLKRLFTPQEAKLATHLTLDREDASVIAARAGLALGEAEQLLDEMDRKGLIFSVQPEDGVALYQAAPFIIGIYEFQINNLDEGYLEDLAAYMSTRGLEAQVQTRRQIRTIPVGQSIERHLEVLPYEHVAELIKAHDSFAVAPCICRLHARMEGRACDAPSETCLVFGDWADYYVRGGRGRRIDRAEVLALLEQADAANLVLQPSNSKDIVFLCCCCGCCCGILGELQALPKPAEGVISSFLASLEPELCQGCWTCLERCQMQALTADGSRVALNTDRCIGCGLCASTCPSGALTLVRKPGSEQAQIPVDMSATWRAMAQARIR